MRREVSPFFKSEKGAHLILFRTKVHSMLKNTKCLATFAKLTSNVNKYEY